MADTDSVPTTTVSGTSAAPTPAAGEGPGGLASAFGQHQLSLASLAVHADDYINSHRDVAPPLHVSTTFRYARNPDDLTPWQNIDVGLPSGTAREEGKGRK